MTMNDLKAEVRDMLPEGILERMLDSLGLALKRSDRALPANGRGHVVLTGAGLFLAGALVGGVAALMLTPKAGAELRADIRSKLGSLRQRGERVKDAATSAVKSAAGVTAAPPTGRAHSTDPLFNDALGG